MGLPFTVNELLDLDPRFPRHDIAPTDAFPDRDTNAKLFEWVVDQFTNRLAKAFVDELGDLWATAIRYQIHLPSSAPPCHGTRRSIV